MLRVLRLLLLLISLAVFVFALLSGAESGSWQDVLANSPNAWPWLLLLGLNYLAWKRPKVAALLITAFGLFATYFFNFTGGRFYPLVFALTLSIVLIGVLLGYRTMIKKQ